MEQSKVILKKLAMCIIFVLSLLGFGQTIAFANGVVVWSGSADVAQTINNLNQIEIEIQKLTQKQLELKGLPSDINNLKATIQNTPVAKGSKWLYKDFKYSDNVINGFSESGNTKNNSNLSSLELPSINPITGSKMTTISDYAFAYTAKGKLTIPNTIIHIGEMAFYDSAVSGELIIPESVKFILADAFAINGITDLYFQGSLSYLGYGSFEENKIRHIQLPKTVAESKDSVFSYNELTKISIPATWTEIRGSMFRNNLISELTIPNNIETIGYNAFVKNKLTVVRIPNHTKLNYDPYNQNLPYLTFDSGVTVIRY